MPGYRFTAWLRPLLNLAALAGVLSLAACGGGNGAPNNPYQGGAGPLAISPSVANLYSGNPFVFAVTGGSGPYAITSSDQAVLPVVGILDGNTLVVTPGNVGADTPVTLTVRDAQNQSTTAALTVKPALLLPASITITGNPNCSASGADLCSGQDGTASVLVLGPAGAPLAGRQVRFDVVQGNFALSSTAPGQPLVSSLTVTSDQNGNATVRIVVPNNAATQIATIRATDVTSGSSVVGQFTIAQFVNGSTVLSVIPTGTTTFTGPDNEHCASSGAVTFYVFGGTPPYTVAPTFQGVVQISGAPVPRSGAGFTIVPTGVCFENLTFAIVDATGQTVPSPPTVTNVKGENAAPVPLNVAPGQSGGSASSRVNCAGTTFTFTITGKAPFSAIASDPGVTLSNGGTVATSPGVLSASTFTPGSTVTITIGDASSPQNIKSTSIFCQ
jgi:hypothetical protein